MMTYSALPDHPAYQEIMNRLLDRLDYIRIQPKTILIVGAHPLFLIDKLKQRYSESIIITENAADNAIDLIIATVAMLDEKTVYDCWRALCDEGLLLFASLGPDTLFELRDAFSKIDACAHTNSFLDMHHMGDWMKKYHFSDPVVDREEMILAYDDLDLFFTDLKNVNVKNSHSMRRRGLMTNHRWQTMLSHYAKHKTEDYFPVTLEVIYGHGWKVKLPEDSDEIFISVDSIRRR
jgi:malonyl-CoA O-methyltransferase